MTGSKFNPQRLPIESLEQRAMFHAPALSAIVPSTTASVSSVFVHPAAATTATATVSLSSWSTVAAGPTARGDAGTATVGGKMYVFGGLTDKSVIPKNNSVDL